MLLNVMGSKRRFESLKCYRQSVSQALAEQHENERFFRMRISKEIVNRSFLILSSTSRERVSVIFT
jgi:hypothetical protein